MNLATILLKYITGGSPLARLFAGGMRHLLPSPDLEGVGAVEFNSWQAKAPAPRLKATWGGRFRLPTLRKGQVRDYTPAIRECASVKVEGAS